MRLENSTDLEEFLKSHADIAKTLYQKMMRIRLVEESIVERYPQARMRCPVHLCIGQEAVSAAAGTALGTNDQVVGSHRSHGLYLAKGGDLNALIAELYGKATGCSAGKGGSMHLIDESVGFMGSSAIVGGTIPIAVGLALANQIQSVANVSCVFFGDGATEEGVFYESLNFAAVRKLPVLFVCENNLYSVYSPLKVRQPAHRRIHEVALSMGISAVAGDGNDALYAFCLIKDALDTIRQGQGPCLIEFATYRQREHCGPNYDDHLAYRPPNEVDHWIDLDPIEKISALLVKHQTITPIEMKQMEHAIACEVQCAFDLAEQAPFPQTEELYAHVYRCRTNL